MSLNSGRGFASDNSATIHPDVLAAIARVNVGHTFGYGHDDYTATVEAMFREHFGTQARAFFVFNGTAANVLSLRAACRPWQAAITAETGTGSPDTRCSLSMSLMRPGADPMKTATTSPGITEATSRNPASIAMIRSSVVSPSVTATGITPQ